jgi:hypothetical protein
VVGQIIWIRKSELIDADQKKSVSIESRNTEYRMTEFLAVCPLSSLTLPSSEPLKNIPRFLTQTRRYERTIAPSPRATRQPTTGYKAQ